MELFREPGLLPAGPEFFARVLCSMMMMMLLFSCFIEVLMMMLMSGPRALWPCKREKTCVLFLPVSQTAG